MTPVSEKYIRLRWPGACAACAGELPKGVWAWYDASSKAVRCTTCASAETNVSLGIVADAATHPTAAPAPLDMGMAGAGARRRYQDLRERREQQAREKYGRLGVAATRLAGDPQHVKAWKTGAEGEERVAARLTKVLAGKSVELLHDRRIPKSVANIDHIAIGPGGVTVIDAKNVKGKIAIERTGGLFTKRVEKLRVAGRDRTKLIDGLDRQVAAVRAALSDIGHPDVPVTAALCIADPQDVPVLTTLRMRDVLIAGPRRTAKHAARPGSLTADQIAAVRDGLAHRLPAA